MARVFLDISGAASVFVAICTGRCSNIAVGVKACGCAVSMELFEVVRERKVFPLRFTGVIICQFSANNGRARSIPTPLSLIGHGMGIGCQPPVVQGPASCPMLRLTVSNIRNHSLGAFYENVCCFGLHGFSCYGGQGSGLVGVHRRSRLQPNGCGSCDREPCTSEGRTGEESR